jgi:hypothetical protein
LVAFVIGTVVVAAGQYLANPPITKPVVNSKADSAKPSGIYFVAPNSTGPVGCDPSSGELYPFGWESYLQTHQIPEMKRTARDGRWFFFETKSVSGNSFEFFGIVPDAVEGVDRSAKVVIPGKLIRITDGKITGNVDASYMAPACTFQ